MRQLNLLHTPHGELNPSSRTSALEPDTHSQTPTHPWPPMGSQKHSSGQKSICLALLTAMSLEPEQSPHGAGICNERNKHRAPERLLGAEGVGPVPWALNRSGHSGSDTKKSREGGLPLLAAAMSWGTELWNTLMPKAQSLVPFGCCNGFYNAHLTSMSCEGLQEESETLSSGCWIGVWVCNPRLFAIKSRTFP